MSFFNSKNGSLQEKLKIGSDEVSIAIEDGDIDGYRLTNGGNISHGFYASSGAESMFTMYEMGGDSNNDYFRILTAEHGETIISTFDSVGSAADLTLDPDGDINLNALADVNIPADVGLTFGDDGEKIEGDGTDLTITSSRHLALKSTTGSMYLDSGTGIYSFRPNADSDDQFQITVTEDTGATKLETVSDAADGHLNLNPDGDLLISPASGNISLDKGRDHLISIGTTGAGEEGRDLTISAGAAPIGGSANLNGGDLIFHAGGGDGTGTSNIKFSAKISGTDLPVEAMKINSINDIVIANNLALTGGGSITVSYTHLTLPTKA